MKFSFTMNNGVAYIILHYRLSNKWSIHPSINHLHPFTSRVAQEKCIPCQHHQLSDIETPGPASWWNHSTPLAAWKPFKASCTPSSFSPRNNGNFTGNNDLTWYNQQICAMSQHKLGFQLAKDEHNWGHCQQHGGDSHTQNIWTANG